MGVEPTVFIVDDDAAIRDSLAWIFRSAGMGYVAFSSGKSFLQKAVVEGPSCLLLDLHLPGEHGVEILTQIQQRPELRMPTFVLTASGDVLTAVQSLKLGAVDYLEKPVEPVLLLEKVKQALADHAERIGADAEGAAAAARISSLTDREQELMHMVCDGFSNKQIATKAHISIKTVANHRAHLLAKAKAVNTADMVRLVMLAKKYREKNGYSVGSRQVAGV